VNQVDKLQQLSEGMTWAWVATLVGAGVLVLAFIFITILFVFHGKVSGYFKSRVVKYAVTTSAIIGLIIAAFLINHDYQTRTTTTINQTFAGEIEHKYGATVTIPKTEMTDNTNKVIRDGVVTLVTVEPYGGEWVLKDTAGNLYTESFN
jgi:hypothetical protein